MNRPPNIILTVIDNIGYGDLGCYGCDYHATPALDRLAADGMRFTDFYCTSGVCTPSRASILTGSYPRRVNLQVGGTGHAVLMPVDPKGLHPDEVTLAELLQEQGYATACIGKWHLGDQLPFLPTRHGFDTFLGCPYSEDMVPTGRNPDRPPLPIMLDETVIEAAPDRALLTRRYTEEALRFIEQQQDEPFFLYLSHAMPGSTPTPFASPDFAGKSANGAYGDAVEELDWSCGEIMRKLAELGLEEDTIVIWLSDNGAVHWEPPQGSNLPLKGWGYDTSEGGQRVPCIATWPGNIPAGTVSDSVVTTLDLLPTLATLAQAEPPADRPIDGYDRRSTLFGQTDSESPYDTTGFYYYQMQQLQAVRAGQWKLYLPLAHKLRDLSGVVEGCDGAYARLYDVRHDLGETTELSAQHPDVVERLLGMAELARNELGDWDRPGAGQRPAGWVETPTPRLLETTA